MKNTLEIANVKARLERLHKIASDYDDQIAQRNEIISKSETEIVHRNAIIERKQNIIDQYNKKLEQMISKAGVSTGYLSHNKIVDSLDTSLLEVAVW